MRKTDNLIRFTNRRVISYSSLPTSQVFSRGTRLHEGKHVAANPPLPFNSTGRVLKVESKVSPTVYLFPQDHKSGGCSEMQFFISVLVIGFFFVYFWG